MKPSRHWLLFSVCAVAWLVSYVLLPPMMNGTDVFMFRDAGWNLAAYGHFESAGLMYMPDLVPRLYAHYTPLMPLLFAAYLAVFPRNAYAGTVFNLLVGLAAAAVALKWVLAQPIGRLRNCVALTIAVLPVVFVTVDRPEAIAFVLFTATIAMAARPGARPIVLGLLIALTFLAHPFFAIAAAIWTASFFLAGNWSLKERWGRTLGQIAVTGVSALIPIGAAALLYYRLDPSSLSRFAVHALGFHSGLNTVKSGGRWIDAIRWVTFGTSPVATWTYLASFASILLLAAWWVRHRRELAPQDWLPLACAVACEAISIVLFSFQYNYVIALAFFIPVVLLIAGHERAMLVAPGLALLLFACLLKLPVLGLSLVERAEQGPSYQAARTQAQFLRAHLSSPDDIVTVEGNSYDLFKPEFRHMIHLTDTEDSNHFAGVDGVANCYDGFHSNGLRPFPEKLNAAQFHLIQADPQHLWITLFGHRVMRAQWGYGCDLYVRKSASPSGDGH
jgi:hypothetical protein